MILSFASMSTQLRAQEVCTKWTRVVGSHPYLLNHLNLGNPKRFPISPLKVLRLVGDRVVSLRICLPRFPNRLFVNDYDFSTSLSVVGRNLASLSVIGHIYLPIPGRDAHGISMTTFLDVVTQLQQNSSSSVLNVVLESCSCLLNIIQREINLLNDTKTDEDKPPLPVVVLQCPLKDSDGQERCHYCTGSRPWSRRCPHCQKSHCSECTYNWEWSPEFQFGAENRQCYCQICLIRSRKSSLVNPPSMNPPLWSCTVHCRSCIRIE